ncbi:MAG: DNA primase [Pseudomonadota bacterium]
MAGKIPPQFIDDLLNRVDIVDVINRRVPLKKAGRDYQARCPFHDEKTPSFTVSSQKQFYHCFGCGAHGSAVGFLMEYDGLGFIEAVEDLAGMAGLEVPREEGFQQGPDLRPLYALLEQAAAFYQRQLREHPQAQAAVNYLKDRGLSGEIAARFGIGYAPPGWDNLLKALGKSDLDINRLRETGLISEPEGKRYDRFRERIIFPIRDQRGRVIGFGGRILSKDKDAPNTPKYLNSPETPVFHKGRELYGLYEAKKALRKVEHLLVVEGYMDVVALAQYGIGYAVATLGTATSKDHLELIFRTCPEVVFCFDGDQAGRDAGWKALQVALPVMREGREARFLFLPESEDPDSLVRKEGAEAFQQRLENALPLSEFLFKHLATQVHMESIDGRARLAELAKPLLSKLPNGLFRQMMVQQLEKLVGVEGLSVKEKSMAARKPSRFGKEFQKHRPAPIRMAIALLLESPALSSLSDEIDLGWMQWNAPGIAILKQMLAICQTQPTLTGTALLERFRGSDEFVALLKLRSQYCDFPEEMDLSSEFIGALNRLNEQYRKENNALPRNAPLSELSEELEMLKRRFPGRQKIDEGKDD